MDSLNFSGVVSKAITENEKQVLFTILIGAGALVAFARWWRNRKGPRHGVPVLKRSTSLALIHGGEMALQRLVEYHEARFDAQKLEQAERELKAWFGYERPDFRELARITAKLEMSGKEDTAIQILEEEIRKAREMKKNHEAYELEMFLVEMLIYKGEFKKAQKHKCLDVENISDARRPLYKAIIFLGTSERDKAEDVWQKFCELKTGFSCQPAMKASMEETGIYKICTNFAEFEKIVNKLKDDIKKAKEKSKTG